MGCKGAAGAGPGARVALHCTKNAVAMHVLQYRATKVRLFQVFSWQPKHIKMETVPPELVLGWCTLTSQPGLLVLYIAFYIAIRLDDRVYQFGPGLHTHEGAVRTQVHLVPSQRFKFHFISF